MRERRKDVRGYVPTRKVRSEPLKAVPSEPFEEFHKGTEGRKASTTMVFVRLLSKLLRDKDLGRLVVPIVPDEARTFGMEALFRQVGIYSHAGQTYEPVDMDTLLYYKEASDGQILEEGITEAGSMSSFVAAGTAYANHAVNMIPFYIYYSMFGFQRVGDLMWLAGDIKAKGFMLGATAGRTSLNGEGLQHQDGHSLASGPIINEALKAQQILAEQYHVSADVWSATSYKLLRNDALRIKRLNMLHPTAIPKKCCVESVLENESGVFVAVSDNMKIV